jgi:hypothetical protein
LLLFRDYVILARDRLEAGLCLFERLSSDWNNMRPKIDLREMVVRMGGNMELAPDLAHSLAGFGASYV